MKRNVLIVALLCLALAALLSSCGGNGGDETPRGTVNLYVYNWGEYISDGTEDSLDVNAEFEAYCAEELGMKVNVVYSTYSSNEDLYAKLSSGSVSYDVVVPSDYMVARLAAEGLLREMNPEENIPNYDKIDGQFKGLYYDPDNTYSVPYTFGTVGVIYNTELIEKDDPLIGSWELLWSEKYSGNVLQFNNPRDAFGTAQFLIGVSANSTNPDDWRAALEKLKEQKGVVQGYVMDEVFNKMKGGSAAAAPYYAGDFFTMYEDNERLAFFYPEEGTNVFVDAWCIPSSCRNYDLALEYINFMLETDQAVANAEYLCYASPITEVRENEEYIEYMTDIHEDALSILYDFDASKMEYFYDLPDDIRLGMNELWEELKIESTIGTEIYVICAVVVVLGLGFAVYRFIVKRMRRAAFKKYSGQKQS